MDITVDPIDRLVGEFSVPGDKSISHRAVMLGAIARGETRADNFLMGEDCISTVEAFRAMGVRIETTGTTVIVHGAGLRGLKKPERDLYLGNSGTTMRLIAGILSGQDFTVRLTGDESLSRRPMGRIIEPLKLMGADIISESGNGCAPLVIKGKAGLKPIRYISKVASAQVKSSILLAGLYAEGTTEIEEPLRSRDHTERMLKLFGADVEVDGLRVALPRKKGGELSGKRFLVPGDISSAAFFMVLAAMLKGSDISIREVGINPTRRTIIDVLQRMGARIKVENEKGTFEPMADIKVQGSELNGTIIEEHEIPELIDEIPAISVAMAYSSGKSEIRGVGELRVKETDRVKSMAENLSRIGVNISATGDTITIEGRPKRFKSADAVSFGDHRTAMAMSIAAAAYSGPCVIKDIDCVKTSFPNFYELLGFLKR